MFGLTCNSRAAAAALVISAGLSAFPAVAQPEPGGDRIVNTIAALKAQLNLSPSQQVLWDAAAVSGRAARDAAKQRGLTIRQVASEELAKPTPDLSRIAATADQVHDADIFARRQVRTQWLQLYATFTPDQVAVVKAGIERRMARMESFREHMLRRFGHD